MRLRTHPSSYTIMSGGRSAFLYPDESFIVLSVHSSSGGPFMPGTSLFFTIFLYPWWPFNPTTMPINAVKYAHHLSYANSELQRRGNTTRKVQHIFQK